MNTLPDKTTASNPPTWIRRRWPLLVGALVCLSLISAAAYAKWIDNASSDEDIPLFAVKRGPLTINVSLKGTINNRDLVVVKSEVEGRATILTLIAEGTDVKAGKTLIELDPSPLEDALVQQEITVQNANAAFIRARENRQVVISQGESDIAQAELAYQFAQLDHEKYIKGEYPKQVQRAESDITIAKEELQRASDKLTWSRQLAEEGYITQTELLADELALKRSQINRDMSQTELKLLQEFTHPRQLQQLGSDVEQTRKALERAKLRSRANNVQADADLAARKSEHERQITKEEKINEQLKKCTITAPVDGMVVYATTGRGSWRGQAEPLAELQEVHERQALIHLPTTASMKVDVMIPEASLPKVAEDMFVLIKVESLPGKTFVGRVGKIDLMPDQMTSWISPDLTAYRAEIYIEEGTEDMRAGMTCLADIIVAKYSDVLYVPVQSVVRVGRHSIVYVPGDDGPEMRRLKVGLDNNRMIYIIEGLEEGEQVLLDPPLDESVAPEDEDLDDIPDIETPDLPDREEQTPPRTIMTVMGEATAAGVDLSKLQGENRQEYIDTLDGKQRKLVNELIKLFMEAQAEAAGGGEGDQEETTTDKPAGQPGGNRSGEGRSGRRPGGTGRRPGGGGGHGGGGSGGAHD